MVVGARRAGLSISETADLLGFSCTTISRVYRERSKKEKISRERQFCGWKCLFGARSQKRMARLVWTDRKATVIQTTTHYNWGVQKSISGACQTLKQMDYSTISPHQVPLLSTKTKSSNHWTWQWVHCTQMTSTVTRSQSNGEPLGCGETRDSLDMDVLLTNLHDAIVSIWTKISEDCFPHLVESMLHRIKAVLKCKINVSNK